MKKLVLALVFAAVLTGCDNPQNTVNALREDIREFRAEPTEKQQAEIERNFAKLEAQIAVLEEAGKQDEATNLKIQQDKLRADYSAAKIARTVNDAKNAIEGFGEAFRDAGKSIGDAFRSPTPSSTP